MKGTVVLGFSGGVDSACAAALLRREGWDVRALYLENGSGEADSARACAKAMGLPFEALDARAELEEHVCRPFAEAYRRGETPSPCVLCNPSVKLRLLCERADALGAGYIATGHYARAEGGALYMGRPENDQSYMLCRILPDQLRRLLLPLGGMAKTETRELAASLGLPAAQKPDSMELCFVPDGDYAAWLEQRGDAPGPGDIIYNGAAGAWATPRESEYTSRRYAPVRERSCSQTETGSFPMRSPSGICAGSSRSLRRPSTVRCASAIRGHLRPREPTPRPAAGSASFPKAPCARPRPARPRRCTWTAGCSAAASSPPQGLMIQRIQNRYNYN